MSGRPESWAQLRGELEALGFRPSKRLGQNFLLEDNSCAAIARDAELEPDEMVLEVGMGLGFLTRHLLAAAGRVVAVEIDPRLVEFTRRRLAGEGDLEVLTTDVLASKNRLAESVVAALPSEGRWSLVANLPYAVGSPTMVLLSRRPNPPRRMTVLVQLEVAERLAARPGTSAWGALGARLQALYTARVLRRVPPEAFRPRPKVDSAVVQLDRLAEAPSAAELARFDALLTALFPQRRKLVRGPLAQFLGGREPADAALAASGLDPESRVGALSVPEWFALAESAARMADGSV